MKYISLFYFSSTMLITGCNNAGFPSTPAATTYMVTASGDSGTVIAPSAPQTVNEGATLSLTVTPDSGYALSTSVGGTCATGSWAASVYTTGAISAACTLTFSSTLLPTFTSVSPSSGSSSGGTGVTLTGTLLAGATSITFDGVAATSVNVFNSTTVTAVAPAHSAGAVDVVITTPSGSFTLTNGYTFLATSVGQEAFGGIIACLNGGLENLITATTNNSTAIPFGGIGVVTNATSATDGAANTSLIIGTLGANGGVPYAAQSCDNYEVDSQGNTPCEVGNTCYNDWFVPSGTATGQLKNCLYTNRLAIGGFISNNYWSSTENDANFAGTINFAGGGTVGSAKTSNIRLRCVRAFTP